MSINGIGNGGDWINASIRATFTGQIKPQAKNRLGNQEGDEKAIPEELKPVEKSGESSFQDLLNAKNHEQKEKPEVPPQEEDKKPPLHRDPNFDRMILDQLLKKNNPFT